MTEAQQVDSAVRAHLGPYGRFKRITGAYEAGWPDFYYRLRNNSGFLEDKLIPRSGRRPSHFTLDQLLWGEEEAKFGGLWFLLGLRAPRTWVLYDAPRARAWFDGVNEPLLSVDGVFPTKEIARLIAPRRYQEG